MAATAEELAAIEAQLLADAAGGVQSFSSDGQGVELIDPNKRLDFVERLEGRAAAAIVQPHFGLRFTKLTPPGGGG